MPSRKKARQDADIMLPVKSAELAKILESGIDYPLTINVNQLHASEFKLGDFAVTIQGTLHDLVCEDPLYFYFRRNSLFCMLVWNEYDNNSVLQEKFACATCDVPREVLENLLDKKAFRIVLNPANVQLASSTLILEVYITDNVILSLKSPSEILSSRSVKNVNGAVKHFKNIDYVQLEDRLCLKQSALKILDNIQNSFDPKNELQIFSQYLIPRLRHYQSQAVHWMLRQEEEIVHTEIHPLYTELELKENAKLYYQKYGGFFVKEEYTTGKPLGGILADEMGLGKTIEILALILKHPIPDARLEANLAVFLDSVSKRSTRNTLRHHIERDFTFDSLSEIYFECACGGSYESSDKKLMAQCKNCSLIQHTECMLYNTDVSSYDYLCPYCSVDPSQELLLSRGTVIISPASILYQWRQEIAKHIKENTLKVFVYRGVDQHKFINPQDLADHDIILISYEVLRRELSHLNVPHGASRRALRYPRKFSVIPSPLLAIKWWRICLDEAQMVESVTSKAAEMALQLHTINRWCVTGTPIQKSAKEMEIEGGNKGMRPHKDVMLTTCATTKLHGCGAVRYNITSGKVSHLRCSMSANAIQSCYEHDFICLDSSKNTNEILQTHTQVKKSKLNLSCHIGSSSSPSPSRLALVQNSVSPQIMPEDLGCTPRAMKVHSDGDQTGDHKTDEGHD
ncbi:uncharacterized protein LOC118187600 [Stegodyphus dumicola]|uniref:uncharacterized protein LOC118187600 n=1 Tax=Stegodyphus dumicola TaxID=202533 RepID=UPI0015B2EE5A|nr:uncharacterized protein LOC118187600 [Stegodyphus dumicola]